MFQLSRIHCSPALLVEYLSSQLSHMVLMPLSCTALPLWSTRSVPSTRSWPWMPTGVLGSMLAGGCQAAGAGGGAAGVGFCSGEGPAGGGVGVLAGGGGMLAAGDGVEEGGLPKGVTSDS